LCRYRCCNAKGNRQKAGKCDARNHTLTIQSALT
jgi:hypothetical protein